jgi:hypothetical protein
MAADGSAPLEDIKEALALSSQLQDKRITYEQAKLDPAFATYEKAVQRANQQAAGGTAGFLGSLIGLPVHPYPEGESKQRQLGELFGAAIKREDEADKKLQAYIEAHPEMERDAAIEKYALAHPSVFRDASAVTDFFEDHPEYESKLAVNKKPEERLRSFLIDNFWSKYHELPTLTKKELKEQLGDEYSDFIENQVYDSVTSEQMAVWLKFMGGKSRILTADQELLTDLFSGQLEFTKPETAWRAQVFYNIRTRDYPDYYDQQTEYYADGANKAQIKAKYPELQEYWNWRRDFMRKNPDIVPYITDDEKAIAEAKNRRREPEFAVPTAEEIQVNLSPSMQRLLESGEELPAPAQALLELQAEQYGLTLEEYYGIIGY